MTKIKNRMLSHHENNHSMAKVKNTFFLWLSPRKLNAPFVYLFVSFKWLLRQCFFRTCVQRHCWRHDWEHPLWYPQSTFEKKSNFGVRNLIPPAYIFKHLKRLDWSIFNEKFLEMFEFHLWKKSGCYLFVLIGVRNSQNQSCKWFPKILKWRHQVVTQVSNLISVN